MKAIDKGVDFQEALSITVGKFLIEKGFHLASSVGEETTELVASNEVGLLSKHTLPQPPLRWFSLVRRERPRRAFFGVIWFHNPPRSAIEAHWVFELYGRGYIALAHQLAEELATLHSVKISIRLVREDPQEERRYYDYCD